MRFTDLFIRRPVIAVGTTVVRALESAVDSNGNVAEVQGWTDLAVGPGTKVRAVDALITGLHEPTASHLDLLRAFVDEPLLIHAYDAAVDHGYLWHEFGASMLII